MRRIKTKKALPSALMAVFMAAFLGGCIIYRGHGHYYHYSHYDD